MAVKTHSFNGVLYNIGFAGRIDGVCDVPEDDSTPEIILVEGYELRHLNAAFHESLHAMGVPDKFLHDIEGYSKTEDGARFLWRLGYRICE
jgi:hypothetical protein